MLLLIKLVALQLAWLGCLPIYLTAKQQTFLAKPLNKNIAWSVFTFCSIVATLMLLPIYHPLTASLFTLVVWMTAWIILALWAPQGPKLKQVTISGSLFMLLIGALGGPYVG